MCRELLLFMWDGLSLNFHFGRLRRSPGNPTLSNAALWIRGKCLLCTACSMIGFHSCRVSRRTAVSILARCLCRYDCLGYAVWELSLVLRFDGRRHFRPTAMPFPSCLVLLPENAIYPSLVLYSIMEAEELLDFVDLQFSNFAKSNRRKSTMVLSMARMSGRSYMVGNASLRLWDIALVNIVA